MKVRIERHLNSDLSGIYREYYYVKYTYSMLDTWKYLVVGMQHPLSTKMAFQTLEDAKEAAQKQLRVMKGIDKSMTILDEKGEEVIPWYKFWKETKYVGG